MPSRNDTSKGLSVSANAIPDELILREYRLTVRNLLLTADRGIVANSSPRHATIILEEMIKASTHSFIASAERMSGKVWTDEVLRLLCEARRRGVIVRLLVEEECAPLVEGRLPRDLAECIRKVAKEHMTDDFLNLAVSDGTAYRLEMDKATKKAAFCANGGENAVAMSEWFNNEFVSGERIVAAA